MTDEFQFDDSFDDSFGDFTDSGTKSRVKTREFEAKVKKHIHQLNTSKEAAKRRESAYWLGESGEPKAITALVKAFKKDKEKSVRDAAKYALGMFKALERALDDDKERARAAELLEKVGKQDEIGGRSLFSNRTLIRVQIVLVVTLILFGGLSFLLPAKTPGTVTDVPTPTQVAVAEGPSPTPDLLIAVASVRDLLGKIRQDASNLQRVFLNVQTGQVLDCALTFNDPLPLSADIAADNAELAALIGQLNSARNDLIAVRDAYSRLCQTDPTPVATVAPADVTAPMDSVTTLLRSLAGIDDRINAVETVIQTLPTPVPFTETPSATPSETSTPTPTATVAPSTISNHVIGLESIIQNVTALRGPSTLLIAYWNDAQVAGVTDGCISPTPAIPDDYPPLEAQLVQSVPDLKQAVDQVNLGLGLLRQGWTLFKDSCTNNTLREQAAIGVQVATTAEGAFNSTIELLDKLRDSIR